MELTLVVVSAVLVYVVSSILHPYVKCETCNGNGKHSGALFTYASRPCHRCSGTGQKQRFGAAVLGVGKRRKSMSKIQKSTSSFKDD